MPPHGTNQCLRIWSDELPTSKSHIKTLVGLYFDRVSPLRCLGFIHKPTFMQALDQGVVAERYGEAVMHIICAWGAWYICPSITPVVLLLTSFSYLHKNHLDPKTSGSARFSKSNPVSSWAKRAGELALMNMATPSVQDLMVGFDTLSAGFCLI